MLHGVSGMLSFGAAARRGLDAFDGEGRTDDVPRWGAQGMPPEVRNGQRRGFRKKIRVSGMD